QNQKNEKLGHWHNLEQKMDWGPIEENGSKNIKRKWDKDKKL
ncbi:7024_t:CDS:1, partial [Entrophospora sp. SA101]